MSGIAPSKLKAMQGAGRSDIDLVLTGTDVLAAGIEAEKAAKAAGKDDADVRKAAREAFGKQGWLRPQLWMGVAVLLALAMGAAWALLDRAPASRQCR